jgi:hypothetical protein
VSCLSHALLLINIIFVCSRIVVVVLVLQCGPYVDNTRSTPMTYTGEFVANKFEGTGTFRSRQFSVENGSFKGGLLHKVNTRYIRTFHGKLAKMASYASGVRSLEFAVQVR